MTSAPLTAEALADPRTFADPAAVNALYRRLRQEAPIARAKPAGHRPFWVLTRHHDIMAVERDPELYAAGTRTVLLPEKVEEIYLAKYGDRNGVKPLTHMDGEHHRAHRAVTMEWFAPKNLKRFEPTIRAVAKTFVDRMEDMGGECDFATDIAYNFPLRVIMALMGVPEADEPEVLRMTQRLFSPADKDLKARQQSGARDQAAAKAPGSGDVVAQFAAYFEALGAERRRNPKDDIVSTIANGLVQGCPMARHETVSYYVIVATAGHDTTAASIGGGLSGLLTFPDEMAKLKTNPGLLQTAAEEFVRWTAPVKHFMRTPQREVEWHGTTVAPGEAVMLCYASACRDEAAWPEADRLRVDRTSNTPNLAFGYGPHFCLGRHLATMEIRALFAELLPRLRTIERNGEPSYTESVFVSGLKSLPVRYSF